MLSQGDCSAELSTGSSRPPHGSAAAAAFAACDVTPLCNYVSLSISDGFWAMHEWCDPAEADSARAPVSGIHAHSIVCASNTAPDSAFSVSVVGSVYHLNGDTAGPHNVGARTYYFTNIPSSHPMKLWQEDGACTVTMASGLSAGSSV